MFFSCRADSCAGEKHHTELGSPKLVPLARSYKINKIFKEVDQQGVEKLFFSINNRS